MKLLVCGSRSIKKKKFVYECIDHCIEDCKRFQDFETTELIEGEAPGVDKITRIYGEKRGLPVIPMEADWKQYGKGAGKIRNKEMVDLCDKGIAIWDGKSKGTEHTISLLKEQDKLLKICYYYPLETLRNEYKKEEKEL